MDRIACTDFLTGRAGLLEGAGRLFDFAGSMNTYNGSSTPEEADAKALRQDFAMVGKDLRGAIEQQKTK